MLLKICSFVMIAVLTVKVNCQQTCTCSALDTCVKPFKDKMDQCKNSCKSKLVTPGATKCFDDKRAQMEAMFNCINPCKQTGQSQSSSPQQGPPPDIKGMDDRLKNLKGKAATELNGLDDCMKSCMPQMNSNNGPFQCVQSLKCPPPNFNNPTCTSQFNPSTLCTCLQGVYGAANVPCPPPSAQG